MRRVKKREHEQNKATHVKSALGSCPNKHERKSTIDWESNSLIQKKNTIMLRVTSYKTNNVWRIHNVRLNGKLIINTVKGIVLYTRTPDTVKASTKLSNCGNAACLFPILINIFTFRLTSLFAFVAHTQFASHWNPYWIISRTTGKKKERTTNTWINFMINVSKMRFDDVESCWCFANYAQRLHSPTHGSIALMRIRRERTSGAKFAVIFVRTKNQPSKTRLERFEFQRKSHRETFGIYLLMILFGCDVDVFIIMSMAKTYEMFGLTLNDYISIAETETKWISCKVYPNFGFYFNLFFNMTSDAVQQSRRWSMSKIKKYFAFSGACTFSSCVAMTHGLHVERILQFVEIIEQHFMEK